MSSIKLNKKAICLSENTTQGKESFEKTSASSSKPVRFDKPQKTQSSWLSPLNRPSDSSLPRPFSDGRSLQSSKPASDLSCLFTPVRAKYYLKSGASVASAERSCWGLLLWKLE